MYAGGICERSSISSLMPRLAAPLACESVKNGGTRVSALAAPLNKLYEAENDGGA